VHKVVLHEKLYAESDERYEEVGRKFYEPLMREISSVSTTSLNQTMATLSLKEGTKETLAVFNLKYPQKNDFVRAIAGFLEKVMMERDLGVELNRMVDREGDVWSLFNALFGNYGFDMGKYAELSQSDIGGEEKLRKMIMMRNMA